MHFYAQQSAQNPDPQTTEGVSLADITQRSDEFLNHIALHTMLNLALRNTDNHARNTAVQRTVEGVVQPKFSISSDF